MPGTNTLKFINSLKQKKFRHQHGLFIIEGEKMVDELMESRFAIHSVYATVQWFSERGLVPFNAAETENKKVAGRGNTGNSSLKHSGGEAGMPGKQEPGETKPENRRKERGGVALLEIKEPELARISSLTTPNKVLAVAQIPSYTPDPEDMKSSLTLVLDKVQDPGNMGTLIRSADWFGVNNIILSEDSAEITNPKVVQSTMGSIFRVRFHYLDLSSFLKSPEIKDLPVFGAFLEGRNIYSLDLPDRGLIVLGNESKGISPTVAKLVARKMSIPSFRSRDSSPESLNIAVAGSIILSEFRRKNFRL